jgi:hypothetical protein
MKTLCSRNKTIVNTPWLGFKKTENQTIEILESTGRPQKTKFEKPQTYVNDINKCHSCQTAGNSYYTVTNGLIFPTPTQPRISFEHTIYWRISSEKCKFLMSEK